MWYAVCYFCHVLWPTDTLLILLTDSRMKAAWWYRHRHVCRRRHVVCWYGLPYSPLYSVWVWTGLRTASCVHNWGGGELYVWMLTSPWLPVSVVSSVLLTVTLFMLTSTVFMCVLKVTAALMSVDSNSIDVCVDSNSFDACVDKNSFRCFAKELVKKRAAVMDGCC